MPEFLVSDRDPVDSNRQQGNDQHCMSASGPFGNQRPNEHSEGPGEQGRPDQSELAEGCSSRHCARPKGPRALVELSGSAATARKGRAPTPVIGASLNASRAERQIVGLMPFPVIDSPATSTTHGKEEACQRHREEYDTCDHEYDRDGPFQLDG